MIRSKSRALPALVGKMYSKIHFSRARGWNEPQRHKGHKDRSIIMSIKLITQNLEEPKLAAIENREKLL